MTQSIEVTKLPLPAYIDHLSTCNPDQQYAEVLGDGSSANTKISVHQLAVAINKAAWWLDERLRHLYLSRTFAFVSSASDLRYFILMIAACKTGRLAFYPPPRSDLETHCSLFQKYACKTLLLPHGGTYRSDLQDLIEAESLACIEVPDLDFFFAFNPNPYLWHWSSRTISTEPLVYLQSSGSTGHPKPVKIKHGSFIAQEKWKQIPELGYDSIHFCQWSGKRVLLTLPLFHLFGLAVVTAALQNDFTVLLCSSRSDASNADLVAELIKSTKVDVLITSPSILAEMAGDRKSLDILSQLTTVAFNGGPLAESAGEAIRRRTGILSLMSMTEAGILPCTIPDDKDWQYFQFSPALGLELRPAVDGLYDVVFVRNESLKEYQVPFYTSPELTEYGTGDLFSKHPSKPGLWKWEGRNDDIVVYSTGEKYNPTAMEDAINDHPLISATLVCGTGKFNSALLIEPAMSDHCAYPDVFIEEIWPHVRKANSNSAAHARVMRDMIIVTKPGLPLPRAGKGTVQRKAAMKLYEKEIEALYEAPGAGRKDSKASVLSGFSLITAASQSPLSTSPAAFVQSAVDMKPGLDSSPPISHHSLGINGDHDGISLHVSRPWDHGWISHDAPGLDSEIRNESQMQAIFEKYSADLPITARKPLLANEAAKVVLLTGSTGSFGIYLLDSLLHDKSVAEIICLDRGVNTSEVQARGLIRKGLSVNFDTKPVTFAFCEFSRPYLGLQLEEYKDFLQRTTHIVHNAWDVDSSLPLSHFEKPHIQGVRQLIEFSARSRYGAAICFISSLAAVKDYRSAGQGETIPEVPIEDWTAASHERGYGQAKLIAERVLNAATAQAGIPTTIVRVAQIAGRSSGDGEWQKNEWLPSLVVSSKNIGCLPSSLGVLNNIDWVPIDLAARAVLDLMHHQPFITPERKESRVYHVVNPRPTTWQTLLPVVQSALDVKKTVPLAEWIEMLDGIREEDIDQFPAVKFTAFYRTLLVEVEQETWTVALGSTESRKASETLGNLTPVTGDMLRGWIRRWF